MFHKTQLVHGLLGLGLGPQVLGVVSLLFPGTVRAESVGALLEVEVAQRLPAAEAQQIPAVGGGGGCDNEPIVLGFDGTIENGVQWRGTGVQEDIVGAFGQTFDLGPGTLRCAAFWLTELGFYDGALSDVYVWSGGLTAEPGAVLFLLPDVVFGNVPVWPEVGENRVPIDLAVEGSFTIGCWGQWPGESPGQYFWGVDTDGSRGPAWTNVAFETGYPPGWQHPSVAWEDVTNMAMGVVFEGGPVPVEATSWGRIKALLRE